MFFEVKFALLLALCFNGALAEGELESPNSPFYQAFDFVGEKKFGLPCMWGYVRNLSNPNAKVVEIGTTQTGESINVVKISSSSSSTSVIWIQCGTRSNEWMVVALCMKAILAFIEKPMADFDIYILPASNPDGFRMSRSHRRLWNTNSNIQEECDLITGGGIDISRNFVSNMHSKKNLLSCQVSPKSFSEKESIAIRSKIEELIQKGQKVVLFLDVYKGMVSRVFLPLIHSPEKPLTADKDIQMKNIIKILSNYKAFTSKSAYVSGKYKRSDWLGSPVDWAYESQGIIASFVVCQGPLYINLDRTTRKFVDSIRIAAPTARTLSADLSYDYTDMLLEVSMPLEGNRTEGSRKEKGINASGAEKSESEESIPGLKSELNPTTQDIMNPLIPGKKKSAIGSFNKRIQPGQPGNRGRSPIQTTSPEGLETEGLPGTAPGVDETEIDEDAYDLPETTLGQQDATLAMPEFSTKPIGGLDQNETLGVTSLLPSR